MVLLSQSTLSTAPVTAPSFVYSSSETNEVKERVEERGGDGAVVCVQLCLQVFLCWLKNPNKRRRKQKRLQQKNHEYVSRKTRQRKNIEMFQAEKKRPRKDSNLN